MSNDYGIVLIPDNTTLVTAQHLSNDALTALAALKIFPKAEASIPHVSLYQLNVSETNLPALIAALKDLSKHITGIQFKMDTTLTDTRANIFWRSEEAKTVLKELHTTILETARTYRDKTEPFSQIAKLNSHSLAMYKSDIDKYGIYWGLRHNFDPHITIVYNSGNNSKIEDALSTIKIPPTIFQVRAIALAKLGPAGEVIEIHTIVKDFNASAQQHDNNERSEAACLALR